MKRHQPDRLKPEDRILWNRVARSTAPLKGRTVLPDPEPTDVVLPDELRQSSLVEHRLPAPTAPLQSQEPRQLDKPTKTKLAKGRMPIEATVDLHGMTQAEAHGLLLSFLHQAYAGGLRHVLVITGKGNSKGGDGVLRRAVPGWFSTGMFRVLVGGFDQAAQRHGGAGAIYVRLRRQGPRS